MSVPGADRQKATKLRVRAKAGVITAVESAWLREYDRARDDSKKLPESPRDTGRSASATKRISYTEEETAAAAEGTGTAAEVAAAGMVVREEGRRLDSIIDRGINALVEANKMHQAMNAALLAERQADAVIQRQLLESVRTHFLARTEAEAELERRGQVDVDDVDDIGKLAGQLLPHLLGAMSGAKKPPVG